MNEEIGEVELWVEKEPQERKVLFLYLQSAQIFIKAV